MRKAQKKQMEDFIKLLEQAHIEIKRNIEAGKREISLGLLEQCQEGAIELGKLIEQEEGEDFVTIPLLESYCETVYKAYEGLRKGQDVSGSRIYKNLRRSLIKAENSVKHDIKTRLEVVFLPYKASMWDSLESVWMAADADPDCDAYVMPIPYYDRNPDKSFGARHYEGDDFPDYVPITDFEKYNLADRRPDVIYIHNPYDNGNYVTSVDPRFYSWELKNYTDCLVYIPYYSTAGGMSEVQSLCLSYFYADYIIVQCEKMIGYFDSRVPREKFLPLGSPKFDRVIRMCQNPQEAPKAWKEKMQGRTVYFYNTSLGGMLANTEAFLKKMEYVFQCFEGRDDACLLWRPHPLLEPTFDSMRNQYYPWFMRLKEQFIESGLGIYDDTPDITKTIALCDVYVGDGGTSVTSLFGMAGKPVFILNNMIHSLPEKEDWRGEKINPVFDKWGNDQYQILNNQLWYSEKNDYHYRFYMDLGTGYAGGRYYMCAVEIRGAIYVLPRNARNLLIIKDKKIRKVAFREQMDQAGAFWSSWYNDRYIFLFPYKYPLLVRFNIQTEEIHYVEGITSFNVKYIGKGWQTGGIGIYGNELVFASPEDGSFIFMDIDTLKVRELSSGTKSNFGVQTIITEGENLWLLPMNKMTLACWNPTTGDVREYDDLPEDFQSVRWPNGEKCQEQPFGNMAFSKEDGKDNIIISPNFGNMYLTLNRVTGKMEKWETPIPFEPSGQNGYFAVGNTGGFCTSSRMDRMKINGEIRRIWYRPERRLYDVNINTKECSEIKIIFDVEELKAHEPGFMENSEWMQYCLMENAFNSLKDLLDGAVMGRPFDRERQIKAYGKINTNVDGTCGETIHRFMEHL